MRRTGYLLGVVLIAAVIVGLFRSQEPASVEKTVPEATDTLLPEDSTKHLTTQSLVRSPMNSAGERSVPRTQWVQIDLVGMEVGDSLQLKLSHEDTARNLLVTDTEALVARVKRLRAVCDDCSAFFTFGEETVLASLTLAGVSDEFRGSHDGGWMSPSHELEFVVEDDIGR